MTEQGDTPSAPNIFGIRIGLTAAKVAVDSWVNGKTRETYKQVLTRFVNETWGW